ncbi:MAG: transposase, partial [Candidatus Aminicenantales bacterium]
GQDRKALKSRKFTHSDALALSIFIHSAYPLICCAQHIRGFCPSCHAKRLEEWGEWMREELLLDVPHRQVVFTIPKMLRIFFKYKRRLLGSLCRAAVQALLHYFQATTGAELRPGVVASIQTFGQKINPRPHLHCLVTEGGEDGEGRFHHVAEFQDSLLAEFFSREVFALLLGQELISEALVEKIAGWRYSGFSVHSKVKASTKKEAERVGKYMIRPLLSLERLSFDEKEGKVSYRILDAFIISLDSLAHLPPFFAQVDIPAHYFLSFMTMGGGKIGA